MILTRGFVLVWMVSLLHGISFNLYVHLPGFLGDRGATEFDIGFVFGVSAIAGIAIRPLVGRAIDRGGARGIILLGGVLATLGCSGYLTLEHLPSLGPWIYIMRFAQVTSMASLFTALYALVAEMIPAGRRIEGLGIFGVSGTLSMGLGGILGDILLPGRDDYGRLFLASAAASGMAFVLSLWLRAPRRDAQGAPRTFARAMLQRDLLPLWFVTLLFAAIIATYQTFLKTFVQSTGIGSVGLFFSVYSGTTLIARFAFGSLPERVGHKRVLYPALGCMALGFLVLARTSTAFGIAAAGFLYGAGQGYAFPILMSLVVTRAGSDRRGSAIAVFTSFFDAGTLVGSPLFGFIVQTTSYPAMFLSAATLLTLGTALFAHWDRAPTLEKGGPVVHGHRALPPSR